MQLARGGSPGAARHQQQDGHIASRISHLPRRQLAHYWAGAPAGQQPGAGTVAPVSVAAPEMTASEKFMLDLNGYLVVKVR